MGGGGGGMGDHHHPLSRKNHVQHPKNKAVFDNVLKTS